MKRLLLLVSFALPLSASAQSLDTPFRTTGAFFAVSVADLTASAKWYREKLGLKVLLEPPRTPEVAAIILEGGGLIVELIQQSSARPMSVAAPGVRATYDIHGIFKAGLIVEDFDRTLAALRQRGVTIAIGPFAKSATQPANVIIRDNAGNYIQFFGR